MVYNLNASRGNLGRAGQQLLSSVMKLKEVQDTQASDKYLDTKTNLSALGKVESFLDASRLMSELSLNISQIDAAVLEESKQLIQNFESDLNDNFKKAQQEIRSKTEELAAQSHVVVESNQKWLMALQTIYILTLVGFISYFILLAYRDVMKLFGVFLEINSEQLGRLIGKCRQFLLKLDFPEKEVQ